MDGTGELFRPLLAVLPATVTPRVVRYPTERVVPYAGLVEEAGRQVGDDSDLLLVAESFSGPVALGLAARQPFRVKAVILVASFVCSPAPQWLRHLVTPLVFRFTPPAAVLRRLMTGSDAPDDLVRAVRAAVRRVRPEVMAGRVKDVLSLDCSDALKRFPGPVLYLRPSRDALVGASSLAAIRSARPDVQVRSVNGPHLLLQVRPRDAWREIEQFLLHLH